MMEFVGAVDLRYFFDPDGRGGVVLPRHAPLELRVDRQPRFWKDPVYTWTVWCSCGVILRADRDDRLTDAIAEHMRGNP